MITLDRRRTMGGVDGLPYDEEVAWLKNEGVSYFDIPISSTNTYKKEVSFMRMNNTSSYSSVCICHTSTLFNIWFTATNAVYNYASKETTFSNVNTPTNCKIVLTANQTQFWTSCDNTTRTAPAGTATSSTALRLFKTSSSDNRGGIYAIHYFKMWNDNDELVLDLIPVRIGQIGYMFDRVNWQIYTGIGTFVVGPDVNHPYDAEVEYLESTGDQRVFTGIPFRKIVSTTITMSITKSITSTSAVYGSYFENTTIPSCQCYITADQKWCTISSTNKASFSGITQGAAVVIGTIYTFTVSSTTAQASGYTGALFARNSDESSYLPIDGMRLYSCQVSYGGYQVLDLIPVRIGQVGYLYDKIGKRLLDNNGSNFIIGQDKSN